MTPPRLEPEPEVVTKAKPCPFCEHSQLGMLSVPEMSKDGPIRVWFVWCKHCHADGPQDCSPVYAVDRWNRRRA